MLLLMLGESKVSSYCPIKQHTPLRTSQRYQVKQVTQKALSQVQICLNRLALSQSHLNKLQIWLSKSS
ncbi:hypothetical protein HOLleu_29962 [Holothuria leucospilota]|uniref:Uncharacterized protein n=1 Tax=Holothuria leucospilota TaxID=206669 RepID=A0A9Q1GYV7_HOLLE|nr:hypothetical protein HOLleu_29962 [Holothuria leucospilota]